MMTRSPMRVPSPTETAERAPPIEMQAAPNNLPAVKEPFRESGFIPLPPPPVTGIAKIAEAISAVMGEIGIVGKDGQNKFQNYKYAKMEDILQKLTPLIAKNGLAIIQTELDRSMFDNDSVIAIRYGFTIVHKSGEVWPDRPVQTGASRCRDSKGGFDDKSLNKCHTAARKYFLLALFQIPTGDEDTDPDDSRPQQRAPVPSPNGAAARATEVRQQQAPLPTTPQTIPTDGLSVQAWAPRFIACLVNAKTLAELTEWEKMNTQTLDKVDEKAPLVYESIVKSFQKRQAELSTGAASGPKSDAGAPAAVSPPTQVAPAASALAAAAAKPAGIPDAATQPDEFLKWADAELAKVIDPHSLEVMYNDYIEPQAAGLLPPDTEELLGLWRKHEARLAP